MTIHAEELRRYLGEATGKPVQLRMNENQHSLITTSRDGVGPGVRVSLHRMFLQADDEVLRALACFIVKPTPEVRRVIRCYINTHLHLISQTDVTRPPKVVRGTPKGKHFDLELRASALHRHYFNDKLDFRIIWGRGVRVGYRQNHVTLGTWNERQSVIRIHPMLDLDNVPWFYIDYIIYHEMVHIVVPSTVDGGGRLQHHTPEFYAIERRYQHYGRAQAWEKLWLRKLIKAWNAGRSLPPEAKA